MQSENTELRSNFSKRAMDLEATKAGIQTEFQRTIESLKTDLAFKVCLNNHISLNVPGTGIEISATRIFGFKNAHKGGS